MDDVLGIRVPKALRDSVRRVSACVCAAASTQPKPEMVVASAAAAKAAGKVYYVGEFASTPPPPLLKKFLSTIEETENCVASLYWSLFPHADDHGKKRNGFLVHFFTLMHKTDHFTKTGSGQT